MRAIFIRHGQSTGNAGLTCSNLALLELTELGGQQSREVAASWTETPDLIVTSPYLRTQQTAAATIARFPNVPVEIWPIQEFTYLQPSRWNGTLSSERMPTIERYWNEADPEFCDGDGAESYATMLDRARATLDRLEALPAEVLVYVFSHGQFIQAVRSIVVDSELSHREKMQRFWGKGSPAIANAERIEMEWKEGRGVDGTGCEKPTSDRGVSSDASTASCRPGESPEQGVARSNHRDSSTTVGP
jgi:broad specificity phosphatase PhoE